MLLDNVDPIDARRAQRAQKHKQTTHGVTFRECAERYLAAPESAWRNAVHQGQWRATLSTYAFPILGALPVAAVDTDAVLKVLEPALGRQDTDGGALARTH